MRFGSKSLGVALALLIGFIAALPLHSARADIEPDMSLGVDIPGNDIARSQLSAPDPGLCRLLCDQNGQCRAWTYVAPGQQGPTAICYLKNAAPGSVANRATISGTKPNRAGPQPGAARVDQTMMFGIDFNGADLQSFALGRGDPALCQVACDNNPQCRAWTFIKPGVQGPPICFLKSGVPQPGANFNLVSGMRRAPGGIGTVPGGGVGGPGSGVGWGVWASASGGQWNDPCAIQYNAAQLAGNRYDGNPGYRRVRTRATQREADLDIDQFGRYHKNQPDGVVKMVPCPSGGTVTGGTTGGVTGGGTTYAHLINGNYDSDRGRMVFSTGGGTFGTRGGTLQVTRIVNAVVEGTWRENGGGKCAGGANYGTFRLTFVDAGFSGYFGYCDESASWSWEGRRLR